MSIQDDLTLPTDGIKLQASNTKAFVGDVEFGSGILCVAECNLIWKQDNGKGFKFDYPNIALHAVSSDLNAFPHECLYMIVDKKDENGESISDNEDKEESDDSDNNIAVIRFVPQDKTLLNPLFLAMNECQALYPDSMDDSENDEAGEEDADENEYNEEGEYEGAEPMNEFAGEYFDANSDPNSIQLSERGQQILRRLNINFQDNNQNNTNGNGNGNHSNDDFSSEQYEDAENQ